MTKGMKIEIRSDIIGFLQAARDIFFPQACLACSRGLAGRQELSYCAPCLKKVRLLLEPFCITCGKPFDKGVGKSHLCGYCHRNRWYFRQARAVVRYDPPVAEAVKAFKYRGKIYCLATFAALAKQYFVHHPSPVPDIIIPVPLHPRRLRQRGFNQALMLSKKMFPHWRFKIDPKVLERHHWSQPQTGLSSAERRKNVRNAFTVARPEKITNKKVLVVDDVFTTGATVNECARILQCGGVAEVDVITFARAVG